MENSQHAKRRWLKAIFLPAQSIDDRRRLRPGHGLGLRPRSLEFRSASVESLESRCLLTAASPVGPEFLVNTDYNAGWQAYQSIATDTAGDFVIAYASDLQDGDGYGIMAQRYAANGTPQGSPFQVNDYTPGIQIVPQVGMAGDGSFVIAWEDDNGHDGDGAGIYAKRYDATGAALGAEFRVNTTTVTDQSYPSIAMNASGNCVISWTSSHRGQPDVFAQMYAPNGAPVGGEFEVNDNEPAAQRQSAVAMMSNGNFLIAWQSYDQVAGSDWDVYAKIFNATGASVTSEFNVNGFKDTAGGQGGVSASAGNHQYVLTWNNLGVDGTTGEVDGSIIDPGGSFLKGFVATNASVVRYQVAPGAVSMAPDGTFVVISHSSDPAGDDNYRDELLYDNYWNDVTNKGPESLVNTYTADDQAGAVVSMDPQTNYVVAWASYGQDGSGYGVYAQRYQHPPTITLSPTYEMSEGSSFTPTATPNYPGWSYSWDINGDGVFGDALGGSPTVSWDQLVALGISDGPTTRNVRVRVDTGATGVLTSSTMVLTVDNTLATVQSTVINTQTSADFRTTDVTFSLSVSDPSPDDLAANYTFYLDWNHDFVPDQIIVGPNHFQVTHTFTFDTSDQLSFYVGAKDKDSTGVSFTSLPLRQYYIDEPALRVVTSTTTPGAFDLYWRGSNNSDNVLFNQINPTTIQVTTTRYNGVDMNAVQVVPGVTGVVFAEGELGSDVIDARGLTTISAHLYGSTSTFGSNTYDNDLPNTLYGGAANDLLVGGVVKGDQGESTTEGNVLVGGAGDDTIYGNAITLGGEGGACGNNLILGGDGNDTIYGSAGNDANPGGEGHSGANVIVGGNGSDTIYANYKTGTTGGEGAQNGGSLIISGDTTLSIPALQAILNTWSNNQNLGSTPTFATRVQNITPQLVPYVTNDHAVDQVFGSWEGGLNWYLLNRATDALSQTRPGETQNDI